MGSAICSIFDTPHFFTYRRDMEMTLSPLVIALLVLWELGWTGVACWHAARKNEKGWFIFFCLINLAGIPEIIYFIKQRQTAPPPA